MTRIEFHSNAASKIGTCCRLARGVRVSGEQLVIFSADATLLTELDTLLWTFSALDFLPHCRASDPLASETPIILTDAQSETPHCDVLINLDQTQPESFSRFKRVIEIVGTDEQDVLAGRLRWRYYRDRGYDVVHRDSSGVK